MKGTFTYQCQQCEELLTSAPSGNCPICGSQAVVPLGWYQLSADERGSWLDRIHGRYRHSATRPAAPTPPRIAPIEQVAE